MAAAPLAAWVRANLEYAAILEKIGPLEAEKAKLMKLVYIRIQDLIKKTIFLLFIEICRRLKNKWAN